ncbi:MAG TPA: hypothetical protein VIK39_01750 [Candidatus Angelobacter sp.]
MLWFRLQTERRIHLCFQLRDDIGEFRIASAINGREQTLEQRNFTWVVLGLILNLFPCLINEAGDECCSDGNCPRIHACCEFMSLKSDGEQKLTKACPKHFPSILSDAENIANYNFDLGFETGFDKGRHHAPAPRPDTGWKRGS